jgi:hypothetical protein
VINSLTGKIERAPSSKQGKTDPTVLAMLSDTVVVSVELAVKRCLDHFRHVRGQIIERQLKVHHHQTQIMRKERAAPLPLGEVR